MTLEQLCNTDPATALYKQRMEILIKELDLALSEEKAAAKNLGAARLRYHNAVQQRHGAQRALSRVKDSLRSRRRTLKKRYEISPPITPEQIAAFRQEHGTLTLNAHTN